MTNLAASALPSPLCTGELVGIYGEEVSARLLPGHGVASPLGLWVLLALLAPAAEGEDRRVLEERLGTSSADAHARACALLAAPHPAVHLALACWYRDGVLNDAFSAWAQALPPGVETGAVPSQAEADAWARSHTQEMIQNFPLKVGELTVYVLTSAIATEVSWEKPFDLVDASVLGGEFAGQVTKALHAPRMHAAHRSGIMETSHGLVGVHLVRAREGVEVCSVIADVNTPPRHLHQGLGEVLAHLQSGRAPARWVPLSELPLGDGHAWTLTEVVRKQTPGSSVEDYHALLPAWDATSTHDLQELAEVQAAFGVLREFAGPALRAAGMAFEAKQAVLASFTRTGFKAAAVTALGGRMRGVPRFEEMLVRICELRFNRSFVTAAVAHVSADGAGGPQGAPGASAWEGMPVFTGHIQRPSEAAGT